MSEDTVLHSVLENARKELLDMTARNRLLSTSRSHTRSSRLEIVEELSAEVFRHLVVDGKVMRFLPLPDEDQGDHAGAVDDQLLFQPDDDELDDSELASRHTDNKLQTNLTSARLQKKLLKLFYDARTYEEEQGVNILYLALGFLKWYEDDNSDRERYAPLLLVPVSLDRRSATSRFTLRYTDDDLTTNLSLQARLKGDFGITLPDVPEIEDLNPEEYYAAVAASIRAQPRWEVLPNDSVLWFFSFSKFLMYRDLDPECWPEGRGLAQHPLIGPLLKDEFDHDPPLCDEDDKIDSLIAPIDMVHILDADSSQAVVVEEVKRGRNLVIQGPPGTGKSQTIANMIAAAVNEGKSVLFVAEKMAALEVVRRRLTNVGVGDMCLELHSNKANKRAVLQDLERTLNLGRPQTEDVHRHCEELATCRERLNRHLQIIHTPISPSGLTPYQIVGELVRLRAVNTRPPEFKLENPLEWSTAEFQARINLLHDLVARVEEIGVPQEHPWRGVQLDVVLPMDADRVTGKIPEITARLDRLVDAGTQLAELLSVPVSSSTLDVSNLARLARRLAMAPTMDRGSLASPVWEERRQEIDALLRAGEELERLQSQLDGVVVEAGWECDVTAVRRDLAAHGRPWFRFLRRAYRDAQAALRGILVDQPPVGLEDRLSIVDSLIKGQRVRQAIDCDSGSDLGREAFGARWNGTASDWSALSTISRWETECHEANIDPKFREIYARLDDVSGIGSFVRQIGEDLKPMIADLKELVKLLKLNLEVAFESSDLRSIPLVEFTARLHHWQDDPESLSRWVNYYIRRRRIDSEGMAELAVEIESGKTSAAEAVGRCEMAFYEALIRDSFHNHADLAAFDGASHSQLLDKFKQLDRERIVLARHEVAHAHYKRLPTAGSNVGEVGTVRKEIQKKRRHMPIRKLLVKAGRAVQAIKPVFMMSPISIAQYLEPGAIEFDLLLIDEASQVPPVDALGAIARAKQVVVVGDSKQLPPTRFFSRMLDDDGSDDADDQSVHASDMESILGLCCAQNISQRMLRWHYRSRHHSLITVSNHEFYDDRLQVIPSPGEPGKGQGLVFCHVPNGVFDRGGSATNRVEAKAVAEAVMEHAREHPNQSLGVGTFSVRQRDAILDELEPLRRTDPSLEHFFATATAEPFFVKNLENIQGDERDVIFISVGYGKDASGYMSMNFGPLSNDGGERRLNVLITRARECCRVFSSIHSDDIDLMRARGRGPHAFKAFLKYAQTGLLDTGAATGRDHDSEFERQVARALTASGLETHPQVGVAGFFIDLAVVDPNCPGRYLLGVECDGANYHSSRSARDRDRIREAVLCDRGWIIHRIWSTDWFHRPEEELRKTLAAVEAAKIDWAGRGRDEDNKPAPRSNERVEIARHDGDDDVCQGNGCVAAEPYVVAEFRIQTDQEIHEVPASELARVATRIIEIEGPVHEEEIARRVTQLWGLQRTGRRIREAVDDALRVVARDSRLVRDGSFYSSKDQGGVVVRDRADVSCSTLRKPEMIPPKEIRQAVAAIVRVNFGVAMDEAVSEAARLFGFKSTSSQLRQVVEQVIQSMLNDESLDQRNGKLYVCEA